MADDDEFGSHRVFRGSVVSGENWESAHRLLDLAAPYRSGQRSETKREHEQLGFDIAGHRLGMQAVKRPPHRSDWYGYGRGYEYAQAHGHRSNHS